MSPGGRRPGKLSARDDIVRAARQTFAEEGYDGTSLRAVARAAGVDAALIHHYFDGKAGLFMAAMALPFDPHQVQLNAGAGGASSSPPGAAVVEGFLTMWDLAEGTGSSFVSCVGAMAASPAVADAMREFVRARVWQHIAPIEGESEETTDARRALVASQLMGLAYTRYVLRVPPISTASPSEIGRWVGPTLERYGGGELD
jgi:AcrR family transcriptional regulator